MTLLWNRNPGTHTLVHAAEKFIVDAETGAFDLPEHIAAELKAFPHWLETASTEHVAAVRKALADASGDVAKVSTKAKTAATAVAGTVRKGKAALEADAAEAEAAAKAAEDAAAAELAAAGAPKS